MWARIQDSEVVEITSNDPSGRYHSSLVWVPCTAEVREGWTYTGGTFAAPAPSTQAAPLTPTLWAAAYNIAVNYGSFDGIEIASKVAAAMYMGTGDYWVFLSEPVAPEHYFPRAWDDQIRMNVSQKYGDYFVITSLDANGDPADPENFNIEITRFI